MEIHLDFPTTWHLSNNENHLVLFIQPCYFSEIDRFLIFSCDYAIRGIPLTSPTGYSVDAMPPIVGTRSSFVALDYDSEDEMVYFSDVVNKTLFRSKLDGTGINVIPVIRWWMSTNIEHILQCLCVFVHGNDCVKNWIAVVEAIKQEINLIWSWAARRELHHDVINCDDVIISCKLIIIRFSELFIDLFANNTKDNLIS